MQLNKADLKHEQLRQMLSFNHKTTITNTLVAILMCVELWHVVPRWAVLTWLAITLCITASRYCLAAYYQHHPVNSESITANRLHWFRIGVMSSALIWGLSAWLVYGHEIDKYELFVAYMIAGISAATAIDYLIDLVSALSYLCLAVVPMVVMFMFSQDSVLMIMAVAATGYILFTGSSMLAFNKRLLDGVSLRREAEHLAFYDALTGLPNRRLLIDRLNVSLAHSVRNKQALAVMFLDLDHFKAVNDNHGHEIGDLLLQQFSARLTGFAREADTVARLAGDEFVIVLENLSTSDAPVEAVARQLADRLLSNLQVHYDLGNDITYASTPSIGIAISNHPDNRSAEALIKHADMAMYAVKRSGRNNVSIYGVDGGSMSNDSASLDANDILALATN